MAEYVTRELKAFEEAFEKSKPGDVIVYHIGRTLGGCSSGYYASYLYENGLVELVQRRNGAAAGIFDYCAITKKGRRPERMALPKSWKRQKII